MKGVAFGYLRISKQDESNPSMSPATQREAIDAYCSRSNLELREVFVDLGVSGAVPIGQRAGGRELCRRLAHRTATGVHVVVAKVDRAWRKASDALTTVDEWTRAGVGVHLCNLPIPHVTSPEGRLMLGMLAIFAEWERGQISERTAAALGHRKKKMLRYSKQIPLGYQLVPGGALTPSRDDCLTAYLIDLWGNTNRLSMHRVARRLTTLDRPLPPEPAAGAWVPPADRTPSKLGRPWWQRSALRVGERMAKDEQFRSMVLREVISARAGGWVEPDPLDPDVRARLA